MHIYRDAIVRWVMEQENIPAQTFVQQLDVHLVLGKIALPQQSF